MSKRRKYSAEFKREAVKFAAMPDELRANVEMKYYEAGNMMYVHPPSLAAFKRDLAEFVAANE